MPPNASADNGGFAWMITIRPRGENFTDELIQDVKAYVEEKLKPDWYLLVIEKSNHIHAAIFLHNPLQRSNLITNWCNNPLKGWSDDEKRNFRKWNREEKTGAVMNMTTLQMVSEYLSGEFDTKLGDDFEILAEKLPPADDTALLEEYLPAVNGLKRKRQISVWYAAQEEAYKQAAREIPRENSLLDGITNAPLNEMTLLAFLQHRMYVVREIEIIADERILQQKVRALLAYMRREATGFYQDNRRFTETQRAIGLDDHPLLFARFRSQHDRVKLELHNCELDRRKKMQEATEFTNQEDISLSSANIP